MKEKTNMLLKIGAFLLIIGGVVCGIISIVNSVGTIQEMSSMDQNLLNSYVSSQSQGMFSGSDAVGIVTAIAVVTIILTLVMVVLDVVVGLMGLSRCGKPERWRFFLVWGIVLLIIGLIGMGELFTLRGVFAALCGVAGPVLYIIGAIMQSKAAKETQSSDI